MKKIAKYIPAFLLIILFVGAVMVGKISANGHAESLAKQQAFIEQLKNETDVKSAAIAKSQKDVLLNASGVNFERTEKDKELADRFFQSLFTWKSWEDYDGARNMLIQKYGVLEEDRMVTTFMPKISREEYASQNMRFEKLKPYVINISGANYMYIALASVSSKNKRGVEATGEVALLYTINADEEIFNISAYSLTTRK